jgi:hypothetical protein
MKLKTSELIDRFQSLSNISHDKTTGRIAMAVMCNIKTLEEPYKTALQAFDDLKKKYADKNDKGEPIIEDNHYKISDENFEKLATEFKEINEQEIEVPNMTMLPVNSFDNCENISPAELYSIEFMIEH